MTIPKIDVRIHITLDMRTATGEGHACLYQWREWPGMPVTGQIFVDSNTDVDIEARIETVSICYDEDTPEGSASLCEIHIECEPISLGEDGPFAFKRDREGFLQALQSLADGEWGLTHPAHWLAYQRREEIDSSHFYRPP
jgi:hypothetical protein